MNDSSDFNSKLNNLSAAKRQALVKQLLARKKQKPAAEHPSGRINPDGRYPLSYSQRRLWLLARQDPAHTAYNLTTALRFVGPLDATALQSTFNQLAQRHQLLRARFDEQDGEPVMIIADGQLPLTQIDSDGLHQLYPNLDQSAALNALIAADKEKPFDLATAPLMRLTLIQNKPGDHVLLMTMHHIISDGWSMAILVSELSSLYQQLAAGQAAQLPELPLQYSDYSYWLQQPAQQQMFDKQLAFWLETMKGAPKLLHLATDRPRPPQQRFVGDKVSLKLGAPLVQKLRALAQGSGSTVFMITLACYGVLLGRYANQDDVVVASPVANRSRSEFEAIVGFFINNLMFRLALNPQLSFEQYLAAVKQHVLSAFAHQDVPFDRLVEVLKPPRSSSYNPLFQVAFVLHNTPPRNYELTALRVSPMTVEDRSAKVDLTLELLDTGIDIVGSLEYNSDLFDKATAQRMAAQYGHLLQQLVDAPDLPLAAAGLALDHEKHQLAQFSRAALPQPQGALIHRMFEAAAAEHGDATAVVFEQQHWSYAELNRKANQLAGYLQLLGVRPGERVAICVERSCEMVQGMLAIVKAGGAYVPIDPAYPDARQQNILEDCGAKVLLSQSALGESAKPPVEHLVLLDKLEQNPDYQARSGDNLTGAVDDPDSPAYVIYTSGTTGKPKGVMLSHRNFTASCQARFDYYQTPVKSYLLLFSFAFDTASAGIFWTLFSGGRLCLTRAEQMTDTAKVQQLIADYQVSHVVATASFYQALLADDNADSEAAVEVVIVGGDACSAPLVKQHFAKARFKQAKLYNEYGPTEAAIWACAYQVSASDENSHSIPIGKPVGHNQIHIVDSQMTPQPVGVYGELCISGAGVGQGYLNRDDLTAAQFVEAVDASGQQCRMYRSGDLARWLPDGNIEFAGRLDNQVKIRGFRIELGDIQSVLRGYPEVAEAVVLAQDTQQQSGDKQLVAYVVANPAQSALLTGQIQAYLQQHLPGYMVPAAFAVVDSIPLTPNGKVDIAALKALTPELAKPEYREPKSEIEAALAKIWCDLLSQQKVGLDDDFFTLGGHSLLVTRLVSQVRDKLGVELAVKDLFEHTTLAQQAGLLSNQAKTIQLPDIEVADRSDGAELSYAQQRLWFIDNLEGASSQYNMPSAFAVRGDFNVAAFKAALSQVIERHQILRTHYLQSDGQVSARVRRQYDLPFEQLDLSALDDGQRDALLTELVQAQQQHQFDLSEDLMIDVKLVNCQGALQVILLNLHHIASDGWSMGVLMRELNHYYREALGLSGVNDVTPLTLQYADYAVWQRNWLKGETLSAMVDYWQQQLDGIPQVHNLSLDKPRPARQSFNGASHYLVIEPQLLSRVERFCQDNQLTLFMLLQTTLALLIGRYSNDKDVVIGTPVAGRNHSQIEQLIGFFINTVVLRTSLSLDEPVSQLLKRNRDTIVDGFNNQHVPLEMLMDVLKPERSMSYSPVFQIMLVLENNPEVALQLGELQLEPLQQANTIAKFDLDITATRVDGQLAVGWTYNTDIFELSSITRLADSFRVLLSNIIDDPNQSSGHIGIVDGPIQQQLVQGWQGLQTQIDNSVCLHQLFEQCAEQYPDNTAQVFDGSALSYLELNQRANALAGYLRTQGVGPESIVAVYLERCHWTLCALLAVLKAGGAYLPLDASLPQSRVSYILDDAAAALLLTEHTLLSAMENVTCPTMCIDDGDLEQRLQGFESGNLTDTLVTADNLAYVIYTSGSTGKPKGVCVEHHSAVNLAHYQNRQYQMVQSDRVLQFASMSFDAMCSEWMMALTVGAAIHLLPAAVRDDAEQVALYIQAWRISAVTFSPGLLRSMDLSALAGLRLLLSAGEALDEALAKQLHEELPEVAIYNVYGPTEATVCSSYHRVGSEQGPDTAIGLPVDNAQLLVLNEVDALAPPGAVGELCITGAGLARGYLNRPQLTAETFVASPFGSGRMYRSGDLVKRHDNGNLEYVARRDAQVKIRGFRIELGEIQNQLLLHPQVDVAHVLVKQSGPEESGLAKQLVVYLVAAKDADDSLHETLKAHLSDVLPDYMVPNLYVTVDEMPITANGKVDVKALPDPQQSHTNEDYQAPQGELEQALCEIFGDLLGVNQVGVNDNFFNLGGDSIISIQAVSRAKTKGIYFSVRDLFEQQTVAKLLAHCSTADKVVAVQSAITGTMPLLPIQHKFFADDAEQPHHYNQSFMLLTPQGFDYQALVKIIKGLYRRHDALRLRFHRSEAGWIGEHHEVDDSTIIRGVSEVSLAGLNTEQQLQRLSTEANQTQRSLNYEQGPLFKAVYFNLGNGYGRLLLVCHHLVVDGISWRIMIADIERSWEQLAEGLPLQGAAKTSSYKDWAEALKQHASSAQMAEQRRYWLEQLAIEVPPFPHNAGSAGLKTTMAELSAVSIELSKSDTQALLGECNQAYRTQINELLLAALFLGYQRFSSNQALRLSLEGHGREALFEHIDFNETVGWFTCLYPLILSCPSTDIATIIKQLKEQYRAVPDKGLGFGILTRLSEDNELQALLARQKGLNVTFNYLGQFDSQGDDESNFGYAPESVGDQISPQRREQYDLTINGMVLGQKLAFTLNYSPQQLNPAEAERFFKSFEAALTETVRHCQAVNLATASQLSVAQHSEDESKDDFETEEFLI